MAFVHRRHVGIHREYRTRRPPASIAGKERELPLQTQVALGQLRSGWCSRLNSYWAWIDRSMGFSL